MLYIFGGLPATGKSELSKYLASSISAVYIRIDSIEQELRNAGFKNLYDEGYKIAFSVALDNLRNGLPVVADSTNPVMESRQAWISIAKQAEAPYKEIEIICSNTSEHRSRAENRKTDIPKLLLPNWENVISREYQLWRTADIVLDTAGKTPEQSKQELSKLLRTRNET